MRVRVFLVWPSPKSADISADSFLTEFRRFRKVAPHSALLAAAGLTAAPLPEARRAMRLVLSWLVLGVELVSW